MQQDNEKYDVLLSVLERINKANRSALATSATGCCPTCPYRFDPLLNRKEAWAYTGFTCSTLATWDCTKAYDLQPIKFRNAVRYRLSSLNRLADERLRP